MGTGKVRSYTLRPYTLRLNWISSWSERSFMFQVFLQLSNPYLSRHDEKAELATRNGRQGNCDRSRCSDSPEDMLAPRCDCSSTRLKLQL